MYSLIIVEDEIITRKRMINMIKWNELGFSVVADFGDGGEAIDYFKRSIPDVILTDIKMIQVSGVQLAEYVKIHKLPVEVVFLTSYKDFEYAHSAIEYGVSNYLLKPVSLSKMKEVFLQLRNKLDQKAKSEETMIDFKNRYDELVSYEQQQFVIDSYYGAVTSEKQAQKRLHLLQKKENVCEKDLILLLELLVEKDETYLSFIEDYGMEELQNQLLQVLKSYHPEMEFYPVSWNESGEEDALRLTGSFWVKRKDQNFCSEEKIKEFLGELSNSILALTGVASRIQFYESFLSPVEFALNMQKHVNSLALEQALNGTDYLHLVQEQNMLLCSYISDGDRASGIELSHTLVQVFFRGGPTFAQTQCIFSIGKIVEYIVGPDLKKQNHLYTKCNVASIYPLVHLNELMQWFEQRVKLFYDWMEEQGTKQTDGSLEKVMNCIKNYYCKDLTLSSISEEVYLHPTYISRMIKEQTGKNFTLLLAEYRIQKAVQLLNETNLHVYEVAEKVGFHNLKYFYKVFKKIAGRSPGDFRECNEQIIHK